MIAPKQKIFEHSLVAVAAYFKSYYKNLGARTKECTHSGCGSVWKKGGTESDNWRTASGGYGYTLMKCKNDRWTPYTPQELAVPTCKPEAVCIQLEAAHRGGGGYYGGAGELVQLNFLYDLMEDKIHQDQWYQTYSNGQIEGLIPHTGKAKKWPKPSELWNLNEVLSELKKGI
jgi:hypothetical protein